MVIQRGKRQGAHSAEDFAVGLLWSVAVAHKSNSTCRARATDGAERSSACALAECANHLLRYRNEGERDAHHGQQSCAYHVPSAWNPELEHLDE